MNVCFGIYHLSFSRKGCPYGHPPRGPTPFFRSRGVGGNGDNFDDPGPILRMKTGNVKCRLDGRVAAIQSTFDLEPLRGVAGWRAGGVGCASQSDTERQYAQAEGMLGSA